MNKVLPNSQADELNEAEALYAELVQLYFHDADADAVAPVAERLDALLRESPEFAASIRGDEVRSILAEWRGDLTNAIQYREAEIRKILLLHARTAHTAAWPAVARHYDHADVADRFDLLAALYDKAGDTRWAVSVLRESQHYCEAHDIEFDGDDLLNELKAASEPHVTANA